MTNSIRAMAQGDVALIVVPATKGDFEMAMAKGDHKKREKQGQTRQHSRLCHLMGVEQIIVCINKMDDESVNWSQERYNQIKKEMEKMLTKIGSGFYLCRYVQKVRNWEVIGNISLSINPR